MAMRNPDGGTSLLPAKHHLLSLGVEVHTHVGLIKVQNHIVSVKGRRGFFLHTSASPGHPGYSRGLQD